MPCGWSCPPARAHLQAGGVDGVAAILQHSEHRLGERSDAGLHSGALARRRSLGRRARRSCDCGRHSQVAVRTSPSTAPSCRSGIPARPSRARRASRRRARSRSGRRRAPGSISCAWPTGQQRSSCPCRISIGVWQLRASPRLERAEDPPAPGAAQHAWQLRARAGVRALQSRRHGRRRPARHPRGHRRAGRGGHHRPRPRRRHGRFLWRLHVDLGADADRRASLRPCRSRSRATG